MLFCSRKLFILKNYLKILVVSVSILIASCAKRGSINGGLKDTLAPVIKMSFPKNFGTNFKGKSIKLTFDEYVKLKNVNKQLIISPPLENAPNITPTTASKTIAITFKDTLKLNTTYSFNFGQSIEDNNEGNPYQQFKYVFSTGNYIDSLQLTGKIKDAIALKTDNFVSIMLYDANENYSDSIVYKQKPRYITNTLDSAKVFKLENLKAGKYLLIALKDINNNFKFDPKTEKIGFQKQFITIPNDTIYELELFKEKQAFKSIKPSQAASNRAIMGFSGHLKKPKITITNGAKIIPNSISKFAQKDSLQIWFKRADMDSVSVTIEQDNCIDNFVLKLRKQKADTIKFSPKQNGILPLRDKFIINSNTPLTKIDNSKIMLLSKDSIAVKFSSLYNGWTQEIEIDFKKEPLEKYKMKVLPGAFTDFFEKTNDSLQFKFDTKNISDYGNLRVKLENVKKFPIIVELTNAEGKVLYSQFSDNSNQLLFDLIDPEVFTLRVIYDENGNQEWDSGNFISKKQSEEVLYYPKKIDVRANWDVEQIFDLKD